MEDTTENKKYLLAWGIPEAEIESTLKMLHDISAGIGLPVGVMVYLYGNINVQKCVYMLDLTQFSTRGIPIYQALADLLKTTPERIKELSYNGEITFDHVKQALQAMTSPGGIFHNIFTKIGLNYGKR